MLSVSGAARDSGSKLAVIEGDRQITYDQLSLQVLQLAVAISRANSNHWQPVAFVAHPTLDSLLLFYALLEIGRPALPLNPRLLPEDHVALVEQAGAVEMSFSSDVLTVTR